MVGSHFYISIVSHGHDEFIINNKDLAEITKLPNVTVLVKDNLNQNKIKQVCDKNNYIYITSKNLEGFGSNNNIVFDYIKRTYNSKEDDYFIVLNPDVILTKQEFLKLQYYVTRNKTIFSTINLFRDYNFTVHDPCVRTFPTLYRFFKSFVFGEKYSIEKLDIDKPTYVDWATGAFLCFHISLYKSLCGFDEDYFMYCEDIDICKRASIAGSPLLYIPQIKGIHLAQHASRNPFSRHFLWHIVSIAKYLLKFNRC